MLRLRGTIPVAHIIVGSVSTFSNNVILFIPIEVFRLLSLFVIPRLLSIYYYYYYYYYYYCRRRPS